MNRILQRLRGTDRRSIGESNRIVAKVLARPDLFGLLFDGLLHNDPVVRMRAADAVEKITARHPEYLQPFKSQLIHHVARSDQQEVRWHVAQMFSRLNLTPKERRVVVETLIRFLDDRSRIVKTFSMQALADIAQQEPTLRTPVVRLLATLTRTGSPAMKSRGRRLLTQLRTTRERGQRHH